MSTNANSALKKMPIYNAFDRFEGYWIKNGNRVRNTDDSYTPPVRYWSSIRNGALGDHPKPAIDDRVKSGHREMA
jgi:hypothetical protein